MKHHLCMAPPRVATSELPSKLYTATLCCSFSIDCRLEFHLPTSSSSSSNFFTVYPCFVLRWRKFSLFCASLKESFVLRSLVVVVARSCERDSCLSNFISLRDHSHHGKVGLQGRAAEGEGWRNPGREWSEGFGRRGGRQYAEGCAANCGASR